MRHVPARVVLVLRFLAWLPSVSRRRSRASRSTTTSSTSRSRRKRTRLKAQARVKFTALEDINIATFELHNALRPTRVRRCQRQSLSVERVSQDSTVRISLPNTLTKGSHDTLIFEYEGAIQSADDSPVQGLKLAYIGDPITYLLYAGRWFPMVGYGIDRFTSTISVSVPPGYTVIGSGKQSAGAGR